jgi:hypothetical protein
MCKSYAYCDSIEGFDQDHSIFSLDLISTPFRDQGFGNFPNLTLLRLSRTPVQELNLIDYITVKNKIQSQYKNNPDVLG